MDERTERFLRKVDQNGPIPEECPELGPCWLWMPLGSVNGYGQFTFRGKTTLAHRASHEIFVGPIPDGLTIDHLCRLRSCVNPKHLEPVTRAENLRRAKSWEHGAAFQRNKTHCVNGHPYAGENLRICKDGRRACRTCARTRMAARRAVKRAAQPPQPRPERTHCRKRHVYAEVGWTRSGSKRTCAECSRAKVRAYRERQRAENPRPARTHCRYGHPWVEANIYLGPRGNRSCRPCHNQRTLTAYYTRRAGSRAA